MKKFYLSFLFLSFFFLFTNAYGAHVAVGPTTSFIQNESSGTNSDYINGTGTGLKFHFGFHIDPTLFLINLGFGINNVVLSEGNNDTYHMEYGEISLTMTVFTMFVTFGTGQALISDNEYLPDLCSYNFVAIVLPLSYGDTFTMEAEPFYKSYYGKMESGNVSFNESGVAFNFNIKF